MREMRRQTVGSERGGTAVLRPGGGTETARSWEGPGQPLGAHWPLPALVAAAGLLYVSFQLYTGVMLEDALITYRYAENVALGKGFVYNEGERVLGTTTPLLTIVLAILGRIMGVEQIPSISMVLMWGASLGAGVLTYFALQQLQVPRPVVIAATALFYFHPSMLWASTGGMETPAVVFLMALSFYAYLQRRPGLASTALGLLVLTRPDGIVWAALLGTALLLRQPCRWPSAMLPAGAIVGLWCAFAWWYFGSPIPHSLTAKGVIGQPHGLGGLLSLRRVRRYFRWTADALGLPWPGGRLWILPFLLLMSIPAILARRQASTLGLLLLFTVAFPAAMYLGRAPTGFDWYLLPLTWASIPLLVLVLWQGGRMLVAHSGAPGIPTVLARAVMAGAVVLIATTGLHSAAGEFRLHRSYQLNEETTRQAIGTWLRNHTPENAVVAMEAIGYQGYYSQRRILGLAGLTNPAVLEIVRTTPDYAAAFHRILIELCPDYLVLRSFEVDENRHFHGGPLFTTDRQRQYFDEHYVEVRRFVAPDEIWGVLGALTIYKRLTPCEIQPVRSRPTGAVLRQ